MRYHGREVGANCPNEVFKKVISVMRHGGHEHAVFGLGRDVDSFVLCACEYLADCFLVSFGSSPQKYLRLGSARPRSRRRRPSRFAKELAVWTRALRSLGSRKSAMTIINSEGRPVRIMLAEA
jgi:hypothetical protein